MRRFRDQFSFFDVVQFSRVPEWLVSEFAFYNIVSSPFVRLLLLSTDTSHFFLLPPSHHRHRHTPHRSLPGISDAPGPVPAAAAGSSTHRLCHSLKVASRDVRNDAPMDAIQNTTTTGGKRTRRSSEPMIQNKNLVR